MAHEGRFVKCLVQVRGKRQILGKWDNCVEFAPLALSFWQLNDRQDKTVVHCEGFFSSHKARKPICCQRFLLQISNHFQLFLYVIHNVAFLCATIKWAGKSLPLSGRAFALHMET